MNPDDENGFFSPKAPRWAASSIPSYFIGADFASNSVMLPSAADTQSANIALGHLKEIYQGKYGDIKQIQQSTLDKKGDQWEESDPIELVDYLEQIKEPSTNKLYRGQFEIDKPLETGFFRLRKPDEQDYFNEFERYVKIIQKLHDTFNVGEKLNTQSDNNRIREADIPVKDQIGKAELSEYDKYDEKLRTYISSLQHLGYATILLDWTSSPYVAFYFALEEYLLSNYLRRQIWEKDQKKVRIIEIDRAKLDMTQSSITDQQKKELTKIVFFEAANTLPRKYLQSAWHSFSIFSNHLVPLKYMNSITPGILQSHIVKIDDTKKAIKYLKHLNCTPVNLYGQYDFKVLELTSRMELYLS